MCICRPSAPCLGHGTPFAEIQNMLQETQPSTATSSSGSAAMQGPHQASTFHTSHATMASVHKQADTSQCCSMVEPSTTVDDTAPSQQTCPAESCLKHNHTCLSSATASPASSEAVQHAAQSQQALRTESSLLPQCLHFEDTHSPALQPTPDLQLSASPHMPGLYSAASISAKPVASSCAVPNATAGVQHGVHERNAWSDALVAESASSMSLSMLPANRGEQPPGFSLQQTLQQQHWQRQLQQQQSQLQPQQQPQQQPQRPHQQQQPQQQQQQLQEQLQQQPQQQLQWLHQQQQQQQQPQKQQQLQKQQQQQQQQQQLLEEVPVVKRVVQSGGAGCEDVLKLAATRSLSSKARNCWVTHSFNGQMESGCTLELKSRHLTCMAIKVSPISCKSRSCLRKSASSAGQYHH